MSGTASPPASTDADAARDAAASGSGHWREVFLAFLRLGLTSFGGPVAHLGYFRAEFVERRRWLGERAYADIVALSQFLPGPASSQTGFALGLMRAGYRGGLAAWAGFTLPSALLLLAFAYWSDRVSASVAGAGLIHGLKLVAVAIVAQAVLGMARSLCPDRQRATIAVAALIVMATAPGSWGQIGAIVLAGLAGLVLCRDGAAMLPESVAFPVSRRAGVACLTVFFVLLAITLLPERGGSGSLFDAFYRSGALVFGGGHVVLPLLRDAVVTPGWVPDGTFLAGYGAAQAVPGPLFTFAAFLGAVAQSSRPGTAGGFAGAVIALVAIFLPGILVLMGTLPFWAALRTRTGAQAAMRGVNAAVVGLLASALYNPVWTSAVLTPADFAIVVAAFVLLVVWRAPALAVVAFCAASGLGLAMLG
jgi:chromate transporter